MRLSPQVTTKGVRLSVEDLKVKDWGRWGSVDTLADAIGWRRLAQTCVLGLLEETPDPFTYGRVSR